MLKHVQFIKHHLALFKRYLNFDRERLTGRTHDKDEALIYSSIPKLEDAIHLLTSEVDILESTLTEFHALINLPLEERVVNRNKILASKYGLAIMPTPLFYIHSLLDDFFYMVQQYAVIYRSELPNDHKQVHDSKEVFKEVSVSRYNYQFFINLLKELDENVPADLKKMNSIFEEGRIDEFFNK